MKNNSLLLILLGIVTILAQTVFLREMLVEVNGNEIVFSVYLSLWLLFVACGSFLSRFFPHRSTTVILCFSCLFCLLPLQFILIRNLASALTLISGQMLNLPSIILLGSLIVAPGCLLLGSLFPLLCSLLPDEQDPVSKGYILECTGIITGSIIFAATVFFLPHITLLCLLGSAGFLLLFLTSGRKLIVLPFMIFLLLLPFARSFQRRNYETKYQPQSLLSSQNSAFGRLDITQSWDQKNYYWNGELFASSQNEFYAQQMVNFVLLQHPEPENILLVGGILNGFLPEIQACSTVRSVDYLEMDKNILAQLRADESVNLIRSDPVRYLQRTKRKYDIILLDLPDPSSLYLNRFYTQEFFSSLALVMQDSLSVAALSLSSGTNFMTSQLISLNATVFHTFAAVFPEPILIPASKNILVGSRGNYISNRVDVLQNRNRLAKTWFNDAVIFERCNQLRLEQIMQALDSVPVQINSFSDPQAYLSTISLWMKLTGIETNFFDFLQAGFVPVVVCALLLLAAIGISAFALSRSGEQILNLQIFSVSLVNFVLELILINLFQMQLGYAYLLIFLFTAGFMLGLIGGFLSHRVFQRVSIRSIWLVNLVLIIFLLIVFDLRLPVLFYLLLNIIFAFLEGTLLAKLLKKKKEASARGSTFYFLDSLGAMSGGLIFGIFLLPLIGFKSSLILLISIMLINMIFSSQMIGRFSIRSR